MTPATFIDWSCPSVGGGRHEEMALVFDRRREHRLLVLPAWFDEANKLRRQTVEVMRRLDLSGIDSILPDFPGCNESQAPLPEQTLASWRDAATAAAAEFGATHVLAIRAGGLIVPGGIDGWSYAPTSGAKVLRAMLRARTVAAREAGTTERIAELEGRGRQGGIELAGWPIGPEMFRQLERTEPTGDLTQLDQETIGGSGLWRRAEPDEDPEQADALAAIIAIGMTGR